MFPSFALLTKNLIFLRSMEKYPLEMTDFCDPRATPQSRRKSLDLFFDPEDIDGADASQRSVRRRRFDLLQSLMAYRVSTKLSFKMRNIARTSSGTLGGQPWIPH